MTNHEPRRRAEAATRAGGDQPRAEHTADVLVVTENQSVAALVPELELEGIRAEAVATYREAERFVTQTPRFVAVLDSQLPAEGAQVRALLEQATAPILALQEPPAEPPPSLVEAVVTPAQSAELVFRVKALMLRAGYELPAPLPLPTVRAPVGAAPLALAPAKIIAIFGAKAGVGKTTLAVNLAVGLHRLYNQRVLLVDADLWFGDVAVLMDIPAHKSLFDVDPAQAGNLFEARKALFWHECGIAVLARPPEIQMVDKLETDVLRKAIVACEAWFDYIIIDTPASLDETTLQMLDIADQVLLVTTPEMSAIHNTARFLDVADGLNYRGKLSLVLNRANTGLRTRAIEEALRMGVAATVVSAGPAILAAAAEGVPVLMHQGAEAEQITSDLEELVRRVAGHAVPRELDGRPGPAPSRISPAAPHFSFWKRRRSAEPVASGRAPDVPGLGRPRPSP